MAAERLQKILAHAGIGSRRSCEQFIIDGRVTVDGEVASLGDKADPQINIVALDGERIRVNTELVYVLLNKPFGVVTTAHDPQGRPTVMDFVAPQPRVYPVGRLDFDTTGLLLMTNDGELTNRILHPRYGIEKTYLAQIKGKPPKRALRQLLDGVRLEDGVAQAVRAHVKIASANRSLIELVINEGRNREVRRMIRAAGMNLEALSRSQVGPLHIGDLRPGKVRMLTQSEIQELYRLTGLGGRKTS